MSSKTVQRPAHPVEAATLIFRATVTRTNASNEPTVPKGPGLVVARVDAVLKASPDLGSLVGQEVTIQLATKRPAMKRGDQAIFYATDWVFGKKIAVRELSHHPATPAAEKQVATALDRQPLTRLASRLRSAELAIVGVVDAIHPSPIKEPLSFNAPQWKVATVRIESILKNSQRNRQSAANTVNLLFPGSDDWAPAPQFEQSQSGIFLLRHEPKLGIPPDYFLALDPADFQSREAIGQVQSLLKR
jgi:hypothetical protein